jgi:Flp pilus assembly pilin Flp
MSGLRKCVGRFVSDERGLETVEYAVMTALIVAALVTAIGLLSGAIGTRLTNVGNTISGIN